MSQSRSYFHLWRERAILLGEAKWGMNTIGRSVIQELIDIKVPKVLALLPEAGVDWAVHCIFFARSGFTEPARALAKEHNARLVDLETLDRDLLGG